MNKLLVMLRNFIQKLYKLYHGTPTAQYSLHIGECYYCEDHQEYVATLHTVDNTESLTLPVREIVANQNLLSQIDPVQASSLGWIARETYYKYAANDNLFKSTEVR